MSAFLSYFSTVNVFIRENENKKRRAFSVSYVMKIILSQTTFNIAIITYHLKKVVYHVEVFCEFLALKSSYFSTIFTVGT